MDKYVLDKMVPLQEPSATKIYRTRSALNSYDGEALIQVIQQVLGACDLLTYKFCFHVRPDKVVDEIG